MTAGAVANKHEAAVLNGGVRDLAEIRRDYDFPVYAKTVTCALRLVVSRPFCQPARHHRRCHGESRGFDCWGYRRRGVRTAGGRCRSP